MLTIRQAFATLCFLCIAFAVWRAHGADVHPLLQTQRPLEVRCFANSMTVLPNPGDGRPIELPLRLCVRDRS